MFNDDYCISIISEFKPEYYTLKNVHLVDGKIHYTTKDKSKSIEFLTCAVKTASSQLDRKSYETVVTNAISEQLRPTVHSAAMAGNSMKDDRIEPMASATKKQRLEKTAPA